MCKTDGEEYRQAAELVGEMDRLRRAWHAFRPPPPLTRGDLALLGNLTKMERAGKAPPTAGWLAGQMHQTPPAISQRLRVLEKAGYVARTVSQDDRRVVRVELTDRGREEASLALRHFLGRMGAALRLFGEENTDQLTRLMRQLAGAMAQVDGRDGENIEGTDGIC